MNREDNADAQIVVAVSSQKTIRITWAQKANEVYFDFTMDQSKSYSDWVDFYKGESVEEIGRYIFEVASRFFVNRTRVRTEGHLLVREAIEYAKGDEWHPLLNA